MIDAHHHLWDLQAVHYPWLMAWGEPRFFGDPTPIQRDYLLDEFRRDASACDMVASVHIQVGAADPLAEARWVQSVADSNPGWPLLQVAFADLCAPDLDRHLDALGELSTVRGVRQIVGRAAGEDASTGTNALLADPSFERGLRHLAERGLRFDLQLIPELIPDTAALLARVPELPVALCHAGSPHRRDAAGLAEWAERLVLLAELPQVVCKLSGLGMFEHDWNADSLRPIFDTCLRQFGSDRLMWGSNFPVDSLSGSYARTFAAAAAAVPAAQHGAVFGQTAADFYGFETG